MKIEEFQNKFKVNELLIYENSSWAWSLRPKQLTYCSSVISLKREALHFSDVTVEEFKDYGEIISKLEMCLNKFCRPLLFNYLSLMLVDRHVHTHVFPRFNVCAEKNPSMDAFYPNPVALNAQPLNMSIEDLAQLKNKIDLI
ncbi:MAG: hypothetical protein GJ680_00025 [Alteromonadaceae bacterium]|nr:hypothetical protein [Alteromonadaceae bacterium]